MDHTSNGATPQHSAGDNANEASSAQAVQQESGGQPGTQSTAPEQNDQIGQARGFDSHTPNVIEDEAEHTITARHPDRGAGQSTQAPVLETPRNLDAEPTREFEIPEGLRRRFLVAGNRFHFRDQRQTVAFEDRGRQLVTAQDSPDVAKSMVELAHAKGWVRLKVRGTDEFKRAVWLEASLRGLELRGFDPAPVDLQRLAETRQERERRQVREDQAFEHRTQTAREAAQPEAARAPADEATLTPNQSTAIEALRAVLQERGDSPEQVSAAVDVAEERFSRRRAYIGAVLDHGAAPYDFNDDNDRSHFVRLRTAQGERVIWGVDLARAISDGDIAVGDEIALAFQGRQPVTVKVKQRDQQGHVVGVTEITTNRNRWAAEKVESLRAEALAAIRRGASITTTRQPRVCTYDAAAPSRTQPPEPPERNHSRPVQRAR